MSALPQLSSAIIQPPPAGVQWIDLRTAGERAGLDWKGLRHRLKDWVPHQLAEMRTPPQGGKQQWYVREDADPRFVRGGVSNVENANATFDLRVFTDAQRSEILRQEQIVLAWQAVRGRTAARMMNAATDAYLDELLLRDRKAPSRATLFRWNAKYETHGRAGLVDPRWKFKSGDDGGGSASPFTDFYNELKSWVLDGNQPSGAVCYRIVRAIARKNNWAIPSLRSATRFIDSLPTPKKIHARRGKKAFDDKCAAYIDRDYTTIVIDGVERPMVANDIWCADHHPCDTLVRYGVDDEGKPKFVRPWLTAWEDLRSRKIIGYRFGPIEPDSSTVLLALMSGIERAGDCVPLYAYMDNGKDFDCHLLSGTTKAQRRKKIRIEHDTTRIAGAFTAMRIGIWHAIAYNAKAKPVERWFRTFEEQFGKLQRTYCGNKPENKPHHLAERLKNGEAPTYEDFVADASAWIDRIYHLQSHTGHGMDGRSPEVVYANCRGEDRTIDPTEKSCCLKLTPQPVKCRSNGIQIGNRVYGKGDPRLRPYWDQMVQPWMDPDNPALADIRTLDGAIIADAVTCNSLVPFGQNGNVKMKEATRTMNAHNRKLADVERRGLRRIESPLEILLDDMLTTPPAPTPPAPPTMKLTTRGSKPIQTGLELPPPPSIPLRQAVGSENVAFPAAGSTERRESVLDKLMRNSETRPRAAATPRVSPWDKLREANDDD